MQRLAQADDVDAFAEGARGAVDEDLVAAPQQRVHRIADHPDRRELRRIEAVLAQPAAGEAEGIEGDFLGCRGAGSRGSFEGEARHFDPLAAA